MNPPEPPPEHPRTPKHTLPSTLPPKCPNPFPYYSPSLPPLRILLEDSQRRSFSMFDTICSLPLTSDLFAQSIHPISPLIALGLASGHVQIHRLPFCNSTNGRAPPGAGHGTIETAWRTHRHKGSCRSLSFGPDGALLFSAGADGLVKVATTETGQVVSKVAIPQHEYVGT